MPRPHHREDLSLSMNPVAPAVCEFLSESLKKGLSLGLGKRGVSFGTWECMVTTSYHILIVPPPRPPSWFYDVG